MSGYGAQVKLKQKRCTIYNPRKGVSQDVQNWKGAQLELEVHKMIKI